MLGPAGARERKNVIVLKPLCCRLVEGIGGESAEQLRVEIRGFLRHDFTGESDISHLLHRARIHQECQICSAASNLLQASDASRR